MGKKIQKANLIGYNLLMAKDLWHAHYQILLIILLKQFIKLNVNTKTMIKNVKPAEPNVNVAAVFWWESKTRVTSCQL